MVEGARLESVYTGDRIEGSNPSPSAIYYFSYHKNYIFFDRIMQQKDICLFIDFLLLDCFWKLVLYMYKFC